MRRSTGLYPSAHGIVANDFWDPALEREFDYREPSKSWGKEWWGGEPVRLLLFSTNAAACCTRSRPTS